MDELQSNYRVEFLSRLITKDLVVQCGQCRNDEECFKFALEIIVRYSTILFDSECIQKSSHHSIRLRENGNESFKSGQYYKAIQEYTSSIVYAADSSEELALAYANRSTTLFKLGKYVNCLEDTDRALKLQYPDKFKTKLYRQKGLCLTTLGRPGAASSYKEALVFLAKTNLSESEMIKFRNQLTQLISAPCTLPKVQGNVMQPPLPKVVKPNSELPSASDAVAVRYSQKFGRHLVATREIKPGECLIVEKPFCLRVSPENIYTHCSYCLQVSWTMIPCTYCVNVAYCSESCRDLAWSEYHEVECPIIGLLLDFKFNNVLWISLRTTIMATKKGVNLNALKQELTNVDCNTDPRTKGFGVDGKFHSDQYRSIYSLANNTVKCSPQDLLVRALWVAPTVYILARETMMFGKKMKLDSFEKNPDVIFVGGLILKHVQSIFTTAQYFGASRSERKREHGTALLAVSSLLNHSCDANTTRQWYTDRMAVFATHPIKKDEQVFDFYGPHFNVMKKKERQEHLKRWYFNCECRPCVEDWPLLQNLPSYKRQALTPANKRKLDKVMQKFRLQNASIQKGILENDPNVLKELSKTIELLFPLVQRPCGELSMVLSMLKDYYMAADVVFDYEPSLSLSELVEDRSKYYRGFQLWLSLK